MEMVGGSHLKIFKRETLDQVAMAANQLLVSGTPSSFLHMQSLEKCVKTTPKSVMDAFWNHNQHLDL